MAGYRRSTFLINRKFQLRFSLYVCSWLIALSFIYPLIVRNLFEFFIRIAEHDPAGAPSEILVQTRHQILSLLWAFQAFFLCITFMISVFMSHRVAGPLFKLRQFFGRMKNGDFSTPLSFRKADYFQEIPDSYNEMLGEVRNTIQTNAEAVHHATEVLEQALTRADGAVKPEASPNIIKDMQTALDALKSARDRNQNLKF